MRDYLVSAVVWLASCFFHPQVELATVADDYAIFFKRKNGHVEPIRINNLEPDHNYRFFGKHFRTIRRPEGRLLATFVTVNDVHIGESICGYDSKHPGRGPILRNLPGKLPYAEMMSLNAVAEISHLNPDAVLIKGDLTDAGRPEDLQSFLKIWGKFGSKVHWVCGNHDVHFERPENAPQMVRIDLPGVVLAMIDTSIVGKATGQIRLEQLNWLENIGQSADRPVMVFGHHHIWNPKSKRDPNYFGINPEDSERLIDLFRHNKCFMGYFAGHTHSNRVTILDDLPQVAFVECGAIKEFPGAWNEYRVYETGVQQIMHRLESKESLSWSEKTSKLELGCYEKRHFGKLADRCFTMNTRM